MLGSLTRGAGQNVPGIPGACATRIFYVSGKKAIAICLSAISSPRCCAHHDTPTAGYPKFDVDTLFKVRITWRVFTISDFLLVSDSW